MGFFDNMKGVFMGTDIRIEKGIVTITGAYVNDLIRFTKKQYSAVKFLENICISISGFSSCPTVVFHEFFAMEIYTLFQMAREAGYCKDRRSYDTMKLLAEHTWLSTINTEVPGIFDKGVFGSLVNPKLKPLPVQYEFIRDVYYQKKTQYQLKGYLLSLPPGCGKSLTSLFLSAGLHKTHLIILCPLSLVNSVWVNEVENCFMGKKKIRTVTGSSGELNDRTCDTIIANYESISKITDFVARNFPPEKTMIIVDECHNFKDIDSKRTVELIDLAERFPCKDILLMSGTPVKAFGREVLPILKLLDPYYNDAVSDSLKSVCRYSKLINELMCRRLGFIMFRKTKEEVFTLPPKYEEELKVKVPNAKKFTAKEVRNAMEKYAAERTRYYEGLKPELSKTFFGILERYELTYVQSFTEAQEFAKYIEEVRYLSTHDYSFHLADMAHHTRLYEDTVIIPRLSNIDKKLFREARAVVKYIKLKVMGEVLGNVLGGLRIEMTSAMLDSKVIKDIIQKAKKKTILFSSYADTIKLAAEKCRQWGFRPLVVDGSNSKHAREIADQFNKSKDFNPLIASLQVMSTGHTLNSANTVIFLNVPFRSVDYEQASDRCYRIGQDTEVYIYKMVLDTGEEPNLSTRMQDILAWSKNEFQTIMGDAEMPDEVTGTESFELIAKDIPELNWIFDKQGLISSKFQDLLVPMSTYGFQEMDLYESEFISKNFCTVDALRLRRLGDRTLVTEDRNVVHPSSLVYKKTVK